MGETENTKKAPKKSYWKGLQAEYKKIIWPDKETVAKQTYRLYYVYFLPFVKM